MFEYHDMHANEQDIYAVRMLKELAATEEPPSIPTDNSQPEKWQSIISKINWNYVPLSLLVFIALFVLAKLVSTPSEPTITLVQPALKKPPASSAANLPAKTDDVFLLPNESLEKPSTQVSSGETKLVEKNLVEKNLVQKKVTQKSVIQKRVTQKKSLNKSAGENKTEIPTNTAAKPAVSKIDKVAEKDKSAQKDKTGWETFKDSVKQGSKRQCSQAEIAMNQCR